MSPATHGRGSPHPVRLKRPGDRRSLSRSATRALDLLEIFGEERRPLRAVEVSRILGVTPSTTNQLLKTMVDSAHLVFDARAKTYLPSPRLQAFGVWMVAIAGADGAHGQLHALIADIGRRTGMMVTVSTPNDLFMQVIDQVGPSGHEPERGLQVALFGSAIGSAYLTMLGEAEVARLAYRARIAEAAWPQLLADIAAIREVGYAHGETADGTLWSLAMPLSRLHMPAVIGLAGPAATVTAALDELAGTMHAAIGRWLDDPGVGAA